MTTDNSTNLVRKTYNGTVMSNEDGSEHVKYFKFTPEDIGKYLVIKFIYEEHMFFGGPLGTKLSINHNVLNAYNRDELYGVYKIDWHNEYQQSQNNVDYKIKLVPIGSFEAWCPNRSWYTTDIESHINKEYNLFEENPLFDNEDDAIEFAMTKNFELYPDTRSFWQKLKDKLFNK